MKRNITVSRSSAGTKVTVRLSRDGVTVSDTVKTHLMGVEDATLQAEANAQRALEQASKVSDKLELEDR